MLRERRHDRRPPRNNTGAEGENEVPRDATIWSPGKISEWHEKMKSYYFSSGQERGFPTSFQEVKGLQGRIIQRMPFLPEIPN
jgi:hypothetical protein